MKLDMRHIALHLLGTAVATCICVPPAGAQETAPAAAPDDRAPPETPPLPPLDPMAPVATRVHLDPQKLYALQAGMGFRGALAAGRDGQGIDLVNVQARFAARLHEKFSLEATLEFGRDYRVDYPVPPAQNDVKLVPIETNNLLDAIAKISPNKFMNIWFGRMIPPSDRQNLAGPYLQTAWNAPRTVYRYPSTVGGSAEETAAFTWGRNLQGRDEGMAFWGQTPHGMLKYQGGVFNLHLKPTNTPRLAGRITLALLDPEPGYYAQSTYYGEKDVLSIGFAAQYEKNAVLSYHEPNPTGGGNWEVATRYTPPATRFVWNADLLFEKNLHGSGTVTIEGAFYCGQEALPHYAAGSVLPSPGTADLTRTYSTLGLVAFLMPWKIGIGRLQPMFRWQQQMYDITRTATIDGIRFLGVSQVWTMDAFINYIITGHDLRISVGYQHTRLNDEQRPQFINVGIQMQI